MKRTIKDIRDLIEQKIENAQNNVMYERNRQYPSNKKILKLQGEIEAYQDILILIETSELL